MYFDGKTAIVTGGATGIGRSLALSLAREGAKIAIADIDLENAQSVAEQIESSGGTARAYPCDVVDQDQVAEVFSQAFEDFGAIEFAFLNAGVVQLGKLETLNFTDLEWMFAVNVFGVLQCARCFLRETRRGRKAGNTTAHITFTGSENSLSLPTAGRYSNGAGYNMTKHALHSMAESFRFELRSEDISISLAIPGGVKTKIMSSVQKRQNEFGGSGQLAMPDLDALPPDLDMPPNISPDQAAEIILKGVAEKQFYIPTHEHILQDFLLRAKEIEEAFSTASLS